jgi:hypothetical protein
MIAFLVPTAAMAKNGACKTDKVKFCKDVKAAGGKVGDCLKKHIEEVAPSCKDSLNKPKEPKSADDKAKKKDGSKTQGGGDKPKALESSSSGGGETKP